MRYITQFEVPLDLIGREDHDRYIEHLKKRNAVELGILIGEKEGFKIEDKKSFNGTDIYTLEVVAFKKDKWLKFKDDLKKYIEISQGTLSTFNLIVIGKMLNELQSTTNDITTSI